MSSVKPGRIAGPYGAYQAREVPEDDRFITRVGPGTPGGEWMRRYWNPVAYSHELGELPLAVRVLGEDLVAFRDGRGRAGLLQAHCCHRGTSLEFGIVSERGIRCCYHGWLFDIDGRILETPGEPARSTLKDRVFQGAYPVHEQQGLVFAYMGPPELRPPFPRYDWYGWPDDNFVPGIRHYFPCNWLQVKENAMDPAHVAFLHTIVSGAQFTDGFGSLPETEFVETPNGLTYVAARRIGNNVWVRMVDFLLPNIHQVPLLMEDGRTPHPPDRPRTAIWSVPVDDTNTVILPMLHVRPDEPAPVGLPFGQDALRPHADRQRRPGDYDAQVTQRPIAVHALENLGTIDAGVVMLRRQVREGILAVQRGADPKGLHRDAQGPLPTYANNTVVEVPPAADAEADRALLRRVGREVADQVLRDPTRHQHAGWTASHTKANV